MRFSLDSPGLRCCEGTGRALATYSALTSTPTNSHKPCALERVILRFQESEARDVPQRLTSQAAIDKWFDEKTKGLNNFQKAALKKRWATLEELMSAEDRKRRIVANVIEDFSLKPRLDGDRGTALLVTASIYDACHYYRLFANTPFGQYCGIVTSSSLIRLRSQKSRRAARSGLNSKPTASTCSSLVRQRLRTKRTSKGRLSRSLPT